MANALYSKRVKLLTKPVNMTIKDPKPTRMPSQNSEYLACRPDFIFSDFDIQLAGKRSGKKKKRPAPPRIQWINQPKSSQASLPPNAQHLRFHSKLINQEIGYCIYLPLATRRVKKLIQLSIHSTVTAGMNSLASIRLHCCFGHRIWNMA